MSTRLTMTGLLAMGGLAVSDVAAATCESLSSLSLPNTTVTMAQTVAAGTFTPPPARGGGPGCGRGRGPQFTDVPAFCRVQATLKPTAHSDIKMELWLPAANWNGKFQAVGNGGWAGTISYREGRISCLDRRLFLAFPRMYQ